MDIAVSPRMARRRGATKEHVRHGPVTEEQRSRRAIIGETLRAETFLSCGFVARRVQVHEGHCRSSLRATGQKFSQQQCPEFFNGLLSCEDFIHKTWTHNELRDVLNTVEKIRADERFQKFLMWLNKQKTETIFKTRRNRMRTAKKYS